MSAAGQSPRLASHFVLAALALSGTAALLVRALGAADRARRLLGLTFDGPARHPAVALEIAATNLRLAGACLLGAWAVTQRPKLRPALDAALALLAASNAVALGVALGAYGAWLLKAVALHGALELAAFALVGGAYLAARRGQLTTGHLVVTAAAALVLLLVAALLETYVDIGRDR